MRNQFQYGVWFAIMTCSLLLADASETCDITLFERDFRSGGTAGFIVDGGNDLEVRTTTAEGLILTNRATDGKSRYFRSAQALPFPAADRFTRHRRFFLTLTGSGRDGACARILARSEGKPLYLTMTPPRGAQSTKLEPAAQFASCRGEDDLPDVTELRLYLEIPAGAELRLQTLKFAFREERNHAVDAGTSGNIVSADSAIVRIRPLPRRTPIRRGSTTLADETGRVLGKQPLDATQPEAVFTLGRGFFQFDTEVEYADGVTVRGTGSTAVIGAPLPENRRKISPYGIMTNHMPESLAIAAGGNHNWCFWYPWVLKFNADGQVAPYRMPQTRLLRHAAMAGVLPEAVRKPGQKGLCFPARPDLFAKLLEGWARTNANEFDLLSVYNEPDGHFQGTAREFVEFHRLSARAIRAGAPGTKVFGPVLSSLNAANRRRLAEYIGLGLLDELDGVNVHPYVDGSAPEKEFLENLLALKSLLAAHHYEKKPLYLTEFGWTTLAGTWQKPVTELQQAQYAARSLALISTQGVSGATYFCGRYNPTRSTPPGEIGFSLVERNLEPKPGYAALATAMKRLAEFPAADGTHWEIAPGVHIVLHRTAAQALLIGWTEQGEFRFRHPFTIRGVHDMMGRPLPVDRSGELLFSPSPVYADLAPVPVTEQRLPARRIPDAKRRAGNYLTFALRNNVLTVATETVAPELAILDTTLLPDAVEVAIQAEIPLRNVRVRLLSGDVRAARIWEELPAGAHRLRLPLPPESTGKRLSGRITVRTDSNHSASIPVDFRVLSAQPIAEMAALDKLPEFSLADWDGARANRDRGSLQLGYDRDALYLKLEFADDAHVQMHTGKMIWAGDSLQLAIDADAAEPWQPNVAWGFNGHHVAEYAIALHPEQGVQRYRHQAWLRGLEPGIPGDELTGTVERLHGKTVYRLRIDRRAFGRDRALTPGTVLGFALTINDVAPQQARRTLNLGSGISSGKDPRRYLKLYLQ